MKKILFSLLLVIGLLLSMSKMAWATDYTADANCQGAWLFTEGSGTTVDDSSANSNIGNFRVDSSPEWSATVPTAYVSNSVYFNGDDYINFGADASLTGLGGVGGGFYSCSMDTKV